MLDRFGPSQCCGHNLLMLPKWRCPFNCFCFLWIFSRSSPVDNEFSRNKLHPTLRIMGSQVTGGNWRSQTSAKNTSKPLDFAGSFVILRETSFFTRSRCLIQPMFFRQNSWSPTNDRPVTHGNMKFGTCIHSSPCTLGEMESPRIDCKLSVEWLMYPLETQVINRL